VLLAFVLELKELSQKKYSVSAQLMQWQMEIDLVLWQR
jgi:hypothetical protein